MLTADRIFVKESEELTFVKLCWLNYLHLKWKWNDLLFLRYESNSVISTCLGNLRCSIYDHKNEKLLNFHIITPQIPSCKAPNRFQESYNVKYFKLIKRLKSLQKSRGVFRTQVNIYDTAFLWIYLTAYYFLNKSPITHVQLGYI